MTTPSLAVLGAGSFGTAVATALARAGNPVTLLCRTAEQAARQGLALMVDKLSGSA